MCTNTVYLMVLAKADHISGDNGNVRIQLVRGTSQKRQITHHCHDESWPVQERTTREQHGNWIGSGILSTPDDT